MRRQITCSYAIVKNELLHDSGIFSEEQERTRLLRSVIKRLTQAEQTIILLYAECGSSRKVAAMLNIPRTTMQREISRIKNKIKNELPEHISTRTHRSVCS
jgi:DNA-directed RNA polymerase specialized sigma24 family protein